jgi:predicted nucleic acid-binding protein
MSLFDSSAIINLCGERKLDKLLDGWTLKLAFYELGNAVWKQVHLYKNIKPEEAAVLLGSLIEVFDTLKKSKEGNALEILSKALKEDINYYDASYIQAAIDNDLTLVTDDLQLYNVGKKYVKTMKSDEV